MMSADRSYPPIFFVLLLIFASGSFGQSPQTEQSDAVRAHFSAAQEAQRQKDYATAEREYRAVLDIAPRFAEVHMNLGLLYQIQDKVAEAMPQFRRALQLNPKLAGANFFLGVDYCKLGEGGKAIPYLKAAAQQQPNRADIWSWLGTAHEMSGQYRAEVSTLKHALALDPNNIDLLYLLGHAYERLGQEQVARLQKSAPGSARSEQLLAESYASSSHWSSAVAHFQNALAASPTLPGLHVALGEVFLRAGKVTQATSEFESELRMDPKNLRAVVRRGEARLVHGDIDGALQDWDHAIGVDDEQVERVLGMRETGFGDAAMEVLPDPIRQSMGQLSGELQKRNSVAAQFALRFVASQNGSSSEAADPNPLPAHTFRCSEASLHRQLDSGGLSGLGSCAVQVGARLPMNDRMQLIRALVEAADYDDALQLLEKLPVAQQQSPEASYWRARCYEKLATAAYLQLYRSGPDSYRFHELMGDLEAAREDDTKAIAEYRAAIALKPSLPNLHYSLGHLLWKNLQVADARAEFEAELAINPRHAGALHDLGNTYLLEHQPDKALSILQRAFAADPDDTDVHRDLGTAYLQLQQYQKAEAEYKLTLAHDRDGSTHYQLGRVYQFLGRKNEAAQQFALSTQLNRESHETSEKRAQRLANIENLPQ